MSNEKWNDIWKIMKSGRLEFVDKVENDILCTICKRVLINAHYGPCGCRYCLECITKYLNGEEKLCPGNATDCKDELMDINTNLFTDQTINRKILKVIVKCLQKDCGFKDELGNIESHMRICESRSFECPYVIMGCKECNFVNTDLKKHMLNEIVSHTKLIFEFIDNLKNEIKVLKEDKFELVKNNKDLKKCIEDFQLKYEKDNEELKVKLKEIENKNEEEQKNSIELKREIKIMNDEIKSMKNDATMNKKSINDSTSNLECENNEIKEKLKQIENKLTQEQRESETKIDEINKIITDLKSISKKHQEQENGGEFVWRINNWREKMERARADRDYRLVSESFYSHRNGYKMSLSVCPNGHPNGSWETHLSIECYIMRGEFDDILPWPFKHDVTFELINQQATKVHVSATVRYGDRYERRGMWWHNIDYNRENRHPKGINDSNWVCSNHQFVSLKELMFDNYRSWIDNDQICIKCSVNINR